MYPYFPVSFFFFPLTFKFSVEFTSVWGEKCTEPTLFFPNSLMSPGDLLNTLYPPTLPLTWSHHLLCILNSHLHLDPFLDFHVLSPDLSTSGTHRATLMAEVSYDSLTSGRTNVSPSTQLLQLSLPNVSCLFFQIIPLSPEKFHCLVIGITLNMYYNFGKTYTFLSFQVSHPRIYSVHLPFLSVPQKNIIISPLRVLPLLVIPGYLLL